MGSDWAARIVALLALVRGGQPGPQGPQGPPGKSPSPLASGLFIPFGLRQSAPPDTWMTPGYEPNNPENDFVGFILPVAARPVALAYGSSTTPVAASVTLTLTAVDVVGAQLLDLATIVIPAGGPSGIVNISNGAVAPATFPIGLRQLAGDFGTLESLSVHVAFTAA